MTDEPPKPPADTPLHPPFGHMTIGQQVAYLIGMVLFIGSVLGVAALVAGLLWRLIAAVWGIG